MNEDKIIYLISNIRKSAHSFLEGELVKHGIKGLVVSHGSILYFLYKNNGQMKVTEIAKKIDRTKSTTTILINKLEKSGYVKKINSDSDKRSIDVVLTDKGKEIKDIFLKISNKLLSKVYKDIPEKNRGIIISSLEKILENIKE